MTLSKYNEVMENVKISKDMRDRILSGVEKELEKRLSCISLKDFDAVKKALL